MTKETTAILVQASGDRRISIGFPFGNKRALIWSSSSDIFVGAAIVLEFSISDEIHSEGTAVTLDGIVSVSGVTISITGKASQQDQRDKEKEGQNEESNSPASVVNHECGDRESSKSNRGDQETSDVPDREELSESGVVIIWESLIGREDCS